MEDQKKIAALDRKVDIEGRLNGWMIGEDCASLGISQAQEKYVRS